MKSVISQTHKDWELIIVDDHSEIPVSPASISGGFIYPAEHLKKVKVIRLEKKGAKLVARNRGMKEANGRWICWLDDDDEYSCRYLEYVKRFADGKPGMALMNFGIVRYYRGGGTDFIGIRDFSKEEFKSGLIATGTFVFKRVCFDVVGPFPEATNPTMFAEMSGIPYYNGEEDGKVKHMGNPWGDDFWYFRKLLEKWQSFPLNAYLYYQHVGGGHNV